MFDPVILVWYVFVWFPPFVLGAAALATFLFPAGPSGEAIWLGTRLRRLGVDFRWFCPDPSGDAPTLLVRRKSDVLALCLPSRASGQTDDRSASARCLALDGVFGGSVPIDARLVSSLASVPSSGRGPALAAAAALDLASSGVSSSKASDAWVTAGWKGLSETSGGAASVVARSSAESRGRFSSAFFLGVAALLWAPFWGSLLLKGAPSLWRSLADLTFF